MLSDLEKEKNKRAHNCELRETETLLWPLSMTCVGVCWCWWTSSFHSDGAAVEADARPTGKLISFPFPSQRFLFVCWHCGPSRSVWQWRGRRCDGRRLAKLNGFVGLIAFRPAMKDSALIWLSLLDPVAFGSVRQHSAVAPTYRHLFKPSFSKFHRVLPSCTGLYWVSLFYHSVHSWGKALIVKPCDKASPGRDSVRSVKHNPRRRPPRSRFFWGFSFSGVPGCHPLPYTVHQKKKSRSPNLKTNIECRVQRRIFRAFSLFVLGLPRCPSNSFPSKGTTVSFQVAHWRATFT